jgi:hypothetical protein
MMHSRKIDLRSPRLRDGVAVEWSDRGASLEYREQGCDLDLPREAWPHLRRVLELLGKGASVARIEREAGLIAGEIPELIAELDRFGLVTETDIPKSANGMSGAKFYAELRRFAAAFTRRNSRNVFYHALTKGAATRSQIVGYALEYYHLVQAAPRIIAPSLAHTDTPRTHEVLTDFLTSELGHDRMLMACLQAAGIARDHLQHVMPLPSTFALISSLAVFAAQDPLSFKSALFIYEEADQRFNRALERRCREVGLPPEFYNPILQHGEINDEYDHGDISRTLLAEVPFVTAEEQLVVKKHVAVAIETLVWMEREILECYQEAKSAKA